MVALNRYHLAAIAKQPSLKIQPSIIDMGTCIVSEKIAVETDIVNQGSEPIDIKKVMTSCSCVSVSPTLFVIYPGKSVKLKMLISGPYREQQFLTRALILTNDPHNPIYEIKIIGNFVASDHQLVAYPHGCIVGTLAPGSKTSRVVRIMRNGNVPVGEVKISASKDWIDVNAQEDNKESLRLYITVHLPKNINKINKIDEGVLVRGSDKKDFVRIPVRGTVAPRIELSPKMVLVIPEKNEYRLSIDTYDARIPKLLSHRFQSDTLQMLSCNVYKRKGDHLVVKVERKQSHKGFASGTLLLQYEGVSEPVEVVFVSPPLTLRRNI